MDRIDIANGAPLGIAVVAPPWYSIPPEGYGGIESMVYWLTEGLVARGHDVTLIGAAPTRTTGRFRATFTAPPSGYVGDPFLEVAHAARARNVLEELAPDVVHDHSTAGPLLARAAVPTVVTAHGPLDGVFHDYYQSLASRVLLVAISESQRNLGPELPWFGTVHNAIPVDEYRLGEEKEDFLLFLGRMSPDKGAHLAVEASREAGRRLIMAAKCTEPQELEYYEREVEPLLGDDVEWLGEVDQATRKGLLARASCLVFPIQRDEPFGPRPIEALRAVASLGHQSRLLQDVQMLGDRGPGDRELHQSQVLLALEHVESISVE